MATAAQGAQSSPMDGSPVSANIQMLSVPDVFARLLTQPGGLDNEEAAERLRHFGPNVIRPIRGKPLYLKLLQNFTHLMAILLWIAGVLAFIAGMPQLGIAVWLVVVINGLFSFWQEYKAEKATEALRKMLPLYVRVLRGGQEQRVPADALVPGDVMVLAEGDAISADGRLVQQFELRINQATLSGESHPVRKSAEPVQTAGLARAELPNLVFAGTYVAAGAGRSVVFATGMDTEFGKIAGLTQAMGDNLSPLQREIQVVTKVVSIIAVAIGALFFVISVIFAGMPPIDGFIFAIGMIVAFVPEGLLPTVTLSLAMGVQRMVARHALVKRLSSVETLGCTSVICTDKTGTLTQNEMTVREAWVGGQQFTVTGAGYAPEGEWRQGDQRLSTIDAGLRDLLVAATLCNDARVLPPSPDNPKWSILGDPTEAALTVAAVKAAVTQSTEAATYPRIRELPFESQRKRMSTIHQVAGPANDTGILRVFVKGAPREMLELCTQIRMNGQDGALTDELRCQALDANDRMAQTGLRVLAIATRTLPATQIDFEVETVERDLTLLGLVAMHDPPRPEVAQAVVTAHQAGIRIIMITGDYGLTAESIARRIGIITKPLPRIVTGAELDALDDTALRAALADEVIFARVSPAHKLRIVRSLQAMGQIVAVTGDGVNDAPALKQADIGVAMGVTGTDVAKEAADMILTDDNFASIVAAVEEGRAVYANIRKFTGYVLTSNAPEAVPFICFALSGGRIPLALNVMQILSIDLGTDIVPALALGSEPPEPGIMNLPPRDPKQHVMDRVVLVRAYGVLGITQGFATMASFYAFYWTQGYWGQWLNLPDQGWIYHAAAAMAFAAVVLSQVGNVFAQRSETVSAFKLPWFRNRLIWIGIAVELGLMLALIYVPFFEPIFGMAPFPWPYWLLLVLWAPVLLFVDELQKALHVIR